MSQLRLQKTSEAPNYIGSKLFYLLPIILRTLKTQKIYYKLKEYLGKKILRSQKFYDDHGHINLDGSFTVTVNFT